MTGVASGRGDGEAISGLGEATSRLGDGGPAAGREARWASVAGGGGGIAPLGTEGPATFSEGRGAMGSSRGRVALLVCEGALLHTRPARVRKDISRPMNGGLTVRHLGTDRGGLG